MIPLILASASPRRQELLRQLGREFSVIPSSAEEVHDEMLSPGEVSRINAARKAFAVSRQHPDALVIGMDTVVAMEGRLFGKPGDMAQALEMIMALQGKWHDVITGVCLIQKQKRFRRLFSVRTEVKFRPLSETEIRQYHSLVNPLDKAGAYGIQEQGGLIVETLRGSFTNVVGLPLERLREELSQWESS